MDIENLHIIGSSHISKQSLDEVGNYIETEKPEIIALELDKTRLFSLLSKNKKKVSAIFMIRKFGVKGYIFNLIGAFVEKKLGEIVGVKPGSEMKLAFELARYYDAKISLIDQEIEITLKRLSKYFTWREKGRIVIDICTAGFKKKKIPFDISKVPEDKIIEELLDQVRTRYPNLYKVLIYERNVVMANRLAALIIHYPEKKILAIVGAGHKKGMIPMIKQCLKRHRQTQ